jgi:ABC-type glutathione transport system ATPase component
MLDCDCLSPTNMQVSASDTVIEVAAPDKQELGSLEPLPETKKNVAEGKSVFEFAKINFVVKAKKAPGGVRRILTDVGARVRSGRVLAIMGPSGAGKTTLINALTLQAFGGVTSGSVTLDGEAMSPALFRARCFVVPQQDQHWPFLTRVLNVRLFAAPWL